jgi:hypothetical protein
MSGVRGSWSLLVCPEPSVSSLRGGPGVYLMTGPGDFSSHVFGHPAEGVYILFWLVITWGLPVISFAGCVDTPQSVSFTPEMVAERSAPPVTPR